MCGDAHIKEQWQLLQNLRSTVEGLLVDGVLNVWNVYGGLNRLHNVMERIFKHGCRIFNRNVRLHSLPCFHDMHNLSVLVIILNYILLFFYYSPLLKVLIECKLFILTSTLILISFLFVFINYVIVYPVYI